MSNEIIRIIIDPKKFIESLPHPEKGRELCGDEIISVYLADILNEVGIEAEAQYHDTLWSIAIRGEKCYAEFDDPYDQEDSFLRSIQNFTNEVNSKTEFEAWYSYRNKVHSLNMMQKEPETESKEV